MELPNPNLNGSESSHSHTNSLDSQILRPFSLSMPSEPPEITNWFPSYQYESPDIETSDILEDFNAEGIGIGKEKLISDDGERVKDENLPELRESAKTEKVDLKSLRDNIDSPCLPSLDSEPIHVRNWFSSYEYESPALDTSDGLRDSAYKDSEREGPEFGIEYRNTRKEEFHVDFPTIRNRNDDESTGLVDYKIACGDNKQAKSLKKADTRSEISSDKSKTCLESVLKHCSKYPLLQNQEIITTSEDSAGSNLDLKDYKSDTVNKVSTFQSAQRSDAKKKDGEEISNDGFVTTRKGRFSKAREVHLEKRKGYEKGTERTVLGERTNSQLPCVSGITGKWKCPQKRKPDLGPPLKQLRLERWVHRL